jgi:hypothetical protein
MWRKLRYMRCGYAPMSSVHREDAKDPKIRKRSLPRLLALGNLGALCAFAVHKKLPGERHPPMGLLEPFEILAE